MLRGQRIAILADSENLEITVRDNYGPKKGSPRTAVYPDWKVLLPMIVGTRSLVRLIYYKEKGRRLSTKFRKFWEEELGGEIQQPQKSVDPYIIVDALSLAEKVDVVVIMAGDKDYLPLLPVLKARGCKVEIASFAQAAARELRKEADTFYKLTKEHTVLLSRSTKRS